MTSAPDHASHIDHIWEILPRRFVITGWCTDQGERAEMTLVAVGKSLSVPLGTSRVSRPDVHKALGLSSEASSRLGFFLALELPETFKVEWIELAGQQLFWEAMRISPASRDSLIQRWLDALNWNHTPIRELEGFLQGGLGLALHWIRTPTAPLELLSPRRTHSSTLELILSLPNHSGLAWLQLWRLRQQPLPKELELTIQLDSAFSVLGDPEHVCVELLRSWSVLNLPAPNVVISDSAPEPASCSERKRRALVVDARRWLLPVHSWLDSVLQDNEDREVALSDDDMIQLGCIPMDWRAASGEVGLSQLWMWRQQIETWLQNL